MKALFSNSPDEERGFLGEFHDLKAPHVAAVRPIPKESGHTTLSLARRDHDVPGLIINPKTHMAWRPYQNLIDGELDNRTPGKVTGWMRFHRSGRRPLKVRFDLAGDFHQDIHGKAIRLSNPHPADRNDELGRKGTYMEGFASMQRGETGDITAGLSLGIWTDALAQEFLAKEEQFWAEVGVPASERNERRQELARTLRERIATQESFYPYVPYPYIEWYSESNGRVVLELEPEQVEILGAKVQCWEQARPEVISEERSLAAGLVKALGTVATERLRDERRSDVTTPKPKRVNK